MFDPALAGYWGSADIDSATTTFLDARRGAADKVDGVKIPCSTPAARSRCAAGCPKGVRCYTGDDFHYPELIGATRRASATPCSASSTTGAPRRRRGQRARHRRHGRVPPRFSTRRWSCPGTFRGTDALLQDRRRLARLAGGAPDALHHGGRPAVGALPAPPGAGYELADRLGLFPDPGLAEARMRTLLAVHGVDA